MYINIDSSLLRPHEVKPWFHSWYRGGVETLDAKVYIYIDNSLLAVSMATRSEAMVLFLVQR